MKLKTVDLFAGGGGLSLGFANAGFDIVAALDNWEPAIKLYKQNFSGHPIIKCDLLAQKAFEEIMKYSPDIIIGGPPCQDFSSAGKRDESLGRADLTISFANIINEIRPPFFVMENVARSFQSKAFAKAKEIFQKAGYGLNVRILDASLCGVPQLRKRLFVIGEKEGKDGFLESLIDNSLSDKPMTLREYFDDRLGIEHYYRHPRSYARRAIFSIDEPSPTIRGVNRPVPSGYPGHSGDSCLVNEKIRPLTTKERSLIQTFPESYNLSGSKTELEQIIGNAVPVKLAEFVATRLKEYMIFKSTTGKPDTSSQIVKFPSTPKFQRRIATLSSLRKRIKCA
ncbi:MAG: DNA cytosine methyltransferase [Lentisphaerae bacterium]|nr:DNA cytosine methyltransferase [Lentisphaerota bacterium]